MTRGRGLALMPVAGAAWASAAAATTHPTAAAPIAGGCWLLALLCVGAMHPLPPGARRALVIAVLSFALAGAAASHAAYAQPERARAAELVERASSVVVSATVTGKLEGRSDGAIEFDALAHTVVSGQSRHRVDAPITVRFPAGEAPGDGSLDVGSEIEARGAPATAEGGRREVFVLACTHAPRVVTGPGGVLEVASALRRGLLSSAAGLPQPAGGLIPGLAVGDTSAVTAELDLQMKTASLSHLTAVSGANCALVVGIVFGLLAACGAPRAVRVLGGGLALVGFVVLVTPEPSVVRAAAMAAIAMLAVLLGRAAAGTAIIAVAICLLLAVDPWLSTSLGFALSAAATAALLLLARPLAHGLARVLPRSLALLVAVPLAAQLACGPLLIAVAPVVPTYGVLANLLAAPAAPLGTVLGLLACLALPVPILADGITVLAWLPAAWISATAQTVTQLPANSLPWPEGPVGAGLLALAGAAVFASIAPRVAPRAVRIVAGATVALIAGVTAGTGLLASVAAPLTVPQQWAVMMCDVGQGDAVLLRSAGEVALVDTGGDPAALDSCLAQAGVGWVDVLVLTHYDDDHAGAWRVLEGRVGTVLHGPLGDQGGPVLEGLRGGGAHLTPAVAGLHGMLGDQPWRVLWPRASDRGFAVGNDLSVVWQIGGAGFPRTVMLGDLSADAQRALLALGTVGEDVDVVKVAHHGSADQHAALYQRMRPALALISVGADNGYGHPRDSLLATLADVGARTLRTDRDGAIAVWRDAGSLRIWHADRGVDGAG